MSKQLDSKGAARVSTPAVPQGAARPWVMLILATAGFAVNFWAWALLSPLGPKFKDVLHLSPFAQALVVAVPVIVGSLGRIPVGALTDRLRGPGLVPPGSLGTHNPARLPP